MIQRILFIFFLLMQVQILFAQSDFINRYEQIIQSYPEIHTGTQYIEQRRSLDGHPYFATSKMENGTLTISGFVFENIPVQYEIWDDLILSFSSAFKQKMIMNHAKIDGIVLSDGTIFTKKSQPDGFIFHKNGFYREIIKGQTGLYCKHRKQRKQETSTAELIRSYEEVEKYFFEIKGQLVAVPAKRKIFPLLELNKKSARRELRKNGLRYRKNKEAYLKTLVYLSNEEE
ncbi:hypothetical protein [Cyclobacterium plantarum]|uniref:hypothetical protein n=1 Tax=Cyclobacterium plantarum TaxID=2716263 RepID=UPI003F72212B